MIFWIALYLAVGLGWVVFTESMGSNASASSRIMGTLIWPIEVGVSIYATIMLNTRK